MQALLSLHLSDPPAQSQRKIVQYKASLSASVEEKLANKTLQSGSNEINKEYGGRLKSFSPLMPVQTFSLPYQAHTREGSFLFFRL